MPEISIIVPVYKVEKYLTKCVDSILRQTFHDFELILVDDGSPDNCGKICDDYAKKDSRIIVIHKENGGLSSARNAGIDIAKGYYIGFVDSDDYIAEDMYETLYNNMVRESADMSMCGLFDVYEGKEPVILPEYYDVVDTQKAIELVLKAEIVAVVAVNKLYKKKLFDTIRYAEGRQAEDAFAIIDLLMECQRVVISSAQKYYYVHRQDSITTKKFSLHDLDIIEAYEKNYNLIKDNYPSLLRVAEMRRCWARFFVLDKMCLSYNEVNKIMTDNIVLFLKEHEVYILRSPEFTWKRKVSYLALKCHFNFYKLVTRLNNYAFKTLSK